jgi:hypothetical protein
MTEKTYEELRREIIRLRPDDGYRADWAYGNTVIENPSITREMADRAVKRKSILYQLVRRVVEGVREMSAGEPIGWYDRAHEFGTDRIPPRPIISKKTGDIQTEKVGGSMDPEKTLEGLMNAHRWIEEWGKKTQTVDDE